MPTSMEVVKRVMRRRKGRRPAPVVDRIEADDGPEFQALVKRMSELGFETTGAARREVLLEIPEYFGAMVDDLAHRQGITSQNFMKAILLEGLDEAYLELRAQMNATTRAKRSKSDQDIL